MAACGLWPSRDGLVAAVADDDGRLISTHLAIRNDADCSGLIQHLDETEGLDWQLVLPEHHRANSVAQIAAENAVAVWIAPLHARSWSRPASPRISPPDHLGALPFCSPRSRSARCVPASGRSVADRQAGTNTRALGRLRDRGLSCL